MTGSISGWRSVSAFSSLSGVSFLSFQVAGEFRGSVSSRQVALMGSHDKPTEISWRGFCPFISLDGPSSCGQRSCIALEPSNKRRRLALRPTRKSDSIRMNET